MVKPLREQIWNTIAQIIIHSVKQILEKGKKDSIKFKYITIILRPHKKRSDATPRCWSEGIKVKEPVVTGREFLCQKDPAGK
jgi:hypothetical protein